MHRLHSRLFYNIARITLGLIMVPNAFIAFFVTPEDMGLNPAAEEVLNDFWNTGYLMHIVKGIEFIAGVSFLLDRYVRVATILLMPIVVNIFLLDLFQEPRGLIIGIPILALSCYLLYYHRDTYQPMLLER